MKRLGRFLALPLLIIAMALQGISPAQASAMPRDAFGQPICSGDGVSTDAAQKKTPPRSGHEHDCCAAACAAATVTVLAAPVEIGLDLPLLAGAWIGRTYALSSLGPRGPPHRPPNARGPPTLI